MTELKATVMKDGVRIEVPAERRNDGSVVAHLSAGCDPSTLIMTADGTQIVAQADSSPGWDRYLKARRP